MHLADFTDLFRQQFDDADAVELTADTRFRDIRSWDSLTGMSVLLMIEEKLGVAIEVEEFKRLDTPRSVLEFIQGREAS